MTARTVAHELNGQLQFLVGYGGLLAERLTGEEAEMAREIGAGARDAAAIVLRLQQIERVAGAETPVGSALDLDASTGRQPDEPRTEQNRP